MKKIFIFIIFICVLQLNSVFAEKIKNEKIIFTKEELEQLKKEWQKNSLNPVISSNTKIAIENKEDTSGIMKSDTGIHSIGSDTSIEGDTSMKIIDKNDTLAEAEAGQKKAERLKRLRKASASYRRQSTK